MSDHRALEGLESSDSDRSDTQPTATTGYRRSTVPGLDASDSDGSADPHPFAPASNPGAAAVFELPVITDASTAVSQLISARNLSEPLALFTAPFHSERIPITSASSVASTDALLSSVPQCSAAASLSYTASNLPATDRLDSSVFSGTAQLVPSASAPQLPVAHLQQVTVSDTTTHSSTGILASDSPMPTSPHKGCSGGNTNERSGAAAQSKALSRKPSGEPPAKCLAATKKRQVAAPGSISSDDPDYMDSHDSSSDSTSIVTASPRPPADESVDRGTRRRRRQPETWKKTIERQRNREKNAHPKQSRCSCALKCRDQFTEQQRQQLCSDFHEKSYEAQKQFLCDFTVARPVKRRRPKGKEPIRDVKATSRAHYLPKGPDRVRVCQNYFLATLAISQQRVKDLPVVGEGEVAPPCQPDGRGKHAPHNKTGADRREIVRAHIASYPTMESHYCRASTKRLYLDQSLSISALFRNYNSQFSVETLDGLPVYGPRTLIDTPVSQWVFEEIFNTEFNLSFFVPKKDQCLLCRSCQNSAEIAEHQHQKELARSIKNGEIAAAMTDSSILCLTFDLQAVLSTPKSPLSPFYYKRKLSVYNLTVYHAGSHRGYCYYWPEYEGKRGSNEIASCLYKHFSENIPADCKHIRMFSDSCGGQNRNMALSSALAHAVATLSIDSVEHKYFEVGHSQMECDSMHSAITRAAKHQEVFNVDEWRLVMVAARPRQTPYTVNQMTHSDFLDFKSLSRGQFSKRIVDSEGNKVNWMQIKGFRYDKAKPDVIWFKSKLSDAGWNSLRLNTGASTRKRSTDAPLQKAYAAQLPISSQKKADLMSLISGNTPAVPARYKTFYEAIPSDSSARDIAPAPGMDEDWEDEY